MQLDAVAEWQRLSFDDVRAFGFLALAGAIAADRAGSPDRYCTWTKSCCWRWRSAWRFCISACCSPGASWPRRSCAGNLPGAWDSYSPARDRPLAQRRSDFRVAGGRVRRVPGAGLPGFAGRPRQSGRGGRFHSPHSPHRKNAQRIRVRRLSESGRFRSRRCSSTAGRMCTPGPVSLRTTAHGPHCARTPIDFLDKYRIDLCLLSRSAPLARVLRYLPGWTERYSDRKSVIFARDPIR